MTQTEVTFTGSESTAVTTTVAELIIKKTATTTLTLAGISPGTSVIEGTTVTISYRLMQNYSNAALPGAKVTLLRNGVAVSSAVTDSSGYVTWSITATLADNGITFKASYAGGNVMFFA